MDKTKKSSSSGVTDKIWFKVLMFAVALGLAAFYIVVLWWGKHPDVGVEYRMYYITHELSDWPGYGKLTYDFGTKEYCTGLRDRNNEYVTYKVCQRKGQGWQRDQKTGSVNKGTESSVYYIPSETKEKAQYTFDINSFTKVSDEAEVSVYANDELIGTFDSAGAYTFTIDTVKKDELLKIKFVANQCEFSLWSVKMY